NPTVILTLFYITKDFGNGGHFFRGGRGRGPPFSPFSRPRPAQNNDMLFCIDGNSDRPIIIDLRNSTDDNSTSPSTPEPVNITTISPTVPNDPVTPTALPTEDPANLTTPAL